MISIFQIISSLAAIVLLIKSGQFLEQESKRVNAPENSQFKLVPNKNGGFWNHRLIKISNYQRDRRKHLSAMLVFYTSLGFVLFFIPQFFGIAALTVIKFVAVYAAIAAMAGWFLTVMIRIGLRPSI